MSTTAAPLDHAASIRAYLDAIEQDGDVPSFYAPDAIQYEHPNGLVREGARRTYADLVAAQARGRRAVRDQRYEIHTVISAGDQAAVRVTWRAVLLVPLGATPAGGELVAYFGVFFRFRDGKIVEQHNYDCFPPF